MTRESAYGKINSITTSALKRRPSHTLSGDWAHEDAGKLVLRITVEGLMLFHGFDKIVNGVEGIAQELAKAGLPHAMAYGVYLGELIAPLLILLGIGTRPAAVVYAATILFATALVHSMDALRVTAMGGWGIETNAFYILTPIAISLLGPGRYALGPIGAQTGRRLQRGVS